VPDAIKVGLALVAAVLIALGVFFLSFAVTGVLWVNAGVAVAAFAACAWFWMRRAVVALAATVLFAVVLASPTLVEALRAGPAAASAEVVAGISREAIPLAGVDAGSGFADLNPLGGIWQGVRVVALGEATYGTSEFFRMKHRLTEFLVTQMAFRHFAMEMEDRVAAPIEQYIQGGGSRNPVAALSWPWGTTEFTALVDWMRMYNASAVASNRVHFHGIDYLGERRDFHMAQNTLRMLDESGAESRVILWAHNRHVSNEPGWMGWYLKNSLHSQIYLTGFEFARGSFTSNLNWVHTYDAEPAGRGYYAEAMERTGKPVMFLDFRSMERDLEVAAWLQQPRYSHELQDMYGVLRLVPSWVRAREPWPSLFDGVVYVERSTPARLM